MKGGWKTKKLGELCSILDSQRKPITKRDRVPGKYPYYGATGIVDCVANFIFDEPLVLVGEDGAKWGSGENSAFSVKGRFWVNNHAHVLRPNREAILDSWIVNYLNHSDLSPFVSGLTVPKLTQGNLREIPVPVPSLAEQQRIVALLDEAVAGLATAKANAEKNLQNANAVFESHLQSVFSQRGEGWAVRRLGDVCAEIFAGGDVPKDNYSKAPTKKHQVPIYTNGERNNGLYGYTESARVKLPSITISARGTIGHTAIRSDSYYPAIRLIVAIPKLELVDLPFLYFAIKSLDIGHSGTSIPQLTVPMVRELPILIPSLPTQRKVADQLETLFAETRALEDLYRQRLVALENLKKSLLHHAFNGRLRGT